MNYCDENGCMNRKRNLVEEPIEMKNIHVLPTDNYSPLVHSTNKYGGYFKSEHYSPMKEMGDSYQNIYITIDEEIKEGDWVYCLTENRVLISNVSYSKLDDRFKIILTTDNDLIKNGVQAIDDEFLEWFVKNTSCEEVKTYIVKLCTNCGQQHCDNIDCRGYKDETQYLISFPNNTTQRIITYCDGYEVNTEKIIIPKEEPKQETLEEAAEKLILEYQLGNTGKIDIEDAKEMLIEFAKYQAERMYSKEDLKEVYFSAIKSTGEGRNGEFASGNSPVDIKKEFTEEFEEWFEQFKKK